MPRNSGRPDYSLALENRIARIFRKIAQTIDRGGDVSRVVALAGLWNGGRHYRVSESRDLEALEGICAFRARCRAERKVQKAGVLR
jgi:hypothetical protein